MRPSAVCIVLALVACGGSSESDDDASEATDDIPGVDAAIDADDRCIPGVYDVAVPEDAPYRLVAAGDYVYWTTAVLDGPKRIRRAEVATGTVVTITETPRELGSLAVDSDGAVYWTEATASTGSGVVMVVRPGGTVQPLYSVPSGLDPFGVAIDDENVYWLVHARSGGFSQTVWRGPKAGGTASMVGTLSLTGSDQSIGAMAADGDFVYWSNGAGLLSRLPRAGGTAVTVIDDADGIGSFTIGGDALYAIIRNSTPAVYRVGLGASPSTPSEVLGSATARWSVAVADGRLYAGTQDDRILSVPVTGGTATIEADMGIRTAGGVAVVGDRLYWASTATAVAGGAVRWTCRAQDL